MNNTSSAYSGKTSEDFHKRSGVKPYVTLRNTYIEEADMDHEEVGREESGPKLIVDIVGGSESATDEKR